MTRKEEQQVAFETSYIEGFEFYLEFRRTLIGLAMMKMP